MIMDDSTSGCICSDFLKGSGVFVCLFFKNIQCVHPLTIRQFKCVTFWDTKIKVANIS